MDITRILNIFIGIIIPKDLILKFKLNNSKNVSIIFLIKRYKYLIDITIKYYSLNINL